LKRLSEQHDISHWLIIICACKNIVCEPAFFKAADEKCHRNPANLASSHRQAISQLVGNGQRGVFLMILPEHHHNVYVVLLDAAVGRLRKVRTENPKRDPKKPCVYVGMTGLAPEERFANHKAGIKAVAVVKNYGLRLLPELYRHLNPMPFAAAAQMEKYLAEDLRRAGYTATGGH
jgi:hypothetical protein